MWTPTPSDELEAEIRAALARPGASRVDPPRPLKLVDQPGRTGWLWGRRRTETGDWLGLATVHTGFFWEGAELHWYPAEQLEVLA